MAEIIKNKIQLKRGEGAPSKGLLDVGEPGYDSKNKRLYVGNGLDVDATAIPNEAYVSQKIAEAALSGSGIDLSSYATKEYVNNEIKNVEDNIDIEDVVYADEDGAEASAAPINASTLGGIPADRYATQEYVIDKIAKAQLEGEDVDLSIYATKNDLANIDYPVDSVNGKTGIVSLNASDVGAVPADLLKCYGSLKDIGIISFPTTMSAVANAMPLNSMIVIDTRLIMAGGAQEISDWGNTSNGTAYINKGNSVARISMMIIYCSGSSVKGRLFVGSWATDTQKVGWADYGYDGNANYPGCFYRTVDGETEWINPPMALGTGYRTAKRYMGKPVYCALVSIGSIAANTGATVNIESFGASKIIYCYIKDAHDFDDRLVYQYGFPSGNISYDAEPHAVFLSNNYSSAWSGAIMIEYIK